MPDPLVTPFDHGCIALGDNQYQDNAIKFAAAGTLLAGTIMARDTTDSTLVPYVIGGIVNGNGTPCAILPDALTAAAAGSLPYRAIISGNVNRNRLVIAADGSNANLTALVEDSLRSRSIVSVRVDQIAS